MRRRSSGYCQMSQSFAVSCDRGTAKIASKSAYVPCIVVLIAIGYHTFIAPFIANVDGLVFLRHAGTALLLGSVFLKFRFFPRFLIPWVSWALITSFLNGIWGGYLPNIAALATLVGWYPAVYMLARQSPEEADIVFLRIFFLYCLVGAVVSIDQAYEWTNIGRQIALLTQYNEAHTISLFFESWSRVTGFVGNPNQMAYTTCMGAIAVISLRHAQRISSLSLWMALVLFSWVICLTYSRTGLIAYIFVFLLYWLYPGWHVSKRISFNRWKFRLVIVGILVLVAFINWELYYDFFMSKKWGYRIAAAKEAFQVRSDIWQAGIAVIDHAPIFGFGYQSPEGVSVVDSDYVYILRNTGIVGVFLYILSFLVLPLISAFRKRPDARIHVPLLMGLLVFLLYGISAAPSIYVAQTAYVAWMWGSLDKRRHHGIAIDEMKKTVRV